MAVLRTGSALLASLAPALLWIGAIGAAGCKSSEAQRSAAVDTSTAAAEGLVKARITGLEQVYARPGADLSGYEKVMLDPIEVSFVKNWDPRPGGQPISASERLQIRDGLAQILREEFTLALRRTGRYRLVESPDENVLRIKADIRDLVINAPDVPRPGIFHTYTLSSGEMTLVAELRDAPTGDLIARVIDHRRDPESVRFELTTRVDNAAAARRAAARWTAILIAQLDAAHRMSRIVSP